MSSVSGDITAKYQRLAQEYAKLRAQIPVLKNAVVDEKSKNAELEAEVHTQESVVRKLRAENEGVSFRNDQLVRRVEQLQDSFQELNLDSKKKKGKQMVASHSQSSVAVSSCISPSESALENELSQKLDENARLHSKIYDIEMLHEKELRSMTDKVESYEAKHEALLMEIQSLKDISERLQQDKDNLTSEISNFTETIKLSKSEQSNGAIQGKNLTVESASASSLTNSDSTVSLSNGSGEKQFDDVKMRNIFREIGRTCQQISASLDNYFTYAEQRSTLYPADISMQELSSNTEEYCRVLILVVDRLKLIGESTQNLLKCCQDFDNVERLKPDLTSLFGELSNFEVDCRDRLIPFFEKCVDEECRVTWCNIKLERANLSWQKSFVHLLNTLCSFSQTFDFDDLSPSANVDNLNRLALAFSDCSNDFSEKFSAKVVLENRLPTATKKLRCTNECLVSCTQSLAKQTLDLSNHCTKWQNQLLLFWQYAFLPIRKNVNIINNNNNNNNNETSQSNKLEQLAEMDNFAEEIDGVCNDQSVTDEELKCEKSCQVEISSQTVDATAVESKPAVADESVDREQKANITKLTFLRVEVESLSRRIVEIEKDRDKALVDNQLIKLKLEKEGKEGKEEKREGNEQQSDRQRIEQALITRYYEDRMDQLLTELQMAKSRANYFQTECDALLKLAVLKRDRVQSLNAQLVSARKDISKLTDELDTTREGYEQQLRKLSEHMADLNAKCTRQSQLMNNFSTHSNSQHKNAGRKSLFK